jgi:glycogen synthase
MSADTIGGVWTYAIDLADALALLGVEVHLATMGRRLSRDQRHEVDASAIAALHESSFALEWQRAWDDVDAAGQWLLALDEELEPDVLHLNGYAHAALARHAPTVVVAHSDVVSWWTAVHGVRVPADWDEYRYRVGEGIRAATALVAPTAAMARAVERHYGRSAQVIWNGRRADWVQNVPKEPVVLSAGRLWDEAKNVAILDRVAPRLSWPVVVAGEGAMVGGRALGRLPFNELAGWLSRAAIYVAPARYEPFGLGVLEAAQAGCALVLSDIDSLREVWGPAAVYVAPDDEDALVRAIASLSTDHDERTRRAAAARDRARRYTPDAMAAAYAALYARLPARLPARAARVRS